MPSPRFILFLLLCSALSGQELRISLGSPGQDLTSLLAVCATLSGVDYRAESLLIERHQETAGGLILLEQVPMPAAHQALALILDAWWAYAEDGAVLFTTAATLPRLATPKPQAYSSTLGGERETIALVERIMAPWTGHPDTGLVFHGPAHRWAAQLDADGHRRFQRLLNCLEHPQVAIPHRLPRSRLPATLPARLPDIQADSWHALLTRLHRLGIPLAATPAALRQPFAAGTTLAGGRGDQVPLRLQTLGVSAAWVDGILGIDLGPVIKREHPAQGLLITRIPIAQFGNSLEQEALAIRLREHTGVERWRRPGHLLANLPRHRALLVACDATLLFELLDLIDRLDREGR